MIRAYNRRQRWSAVISLLIGLFAYAAAAGFFALATWLVLRMIGNGGMPWLQIAVPLAILLLLTVSGWKRHRSQRASDPAGPLLWQSDVRSFTLALTQLRVNQVTSSAWFLSELFFSGPERILRAIDSWRSCLPVDADLEQRMTDLLEELRALGKWQSLDAFLDRWEELSALIRSGHVEFSAVKGRLRAAA